jgi:hypothetical protein
VLDGTILDATVSLEVTLSSPGDNYGIEFIVGDPQGPLPGV